MNNKDSNKDLCLLTGPASTVPGFPSLPLDPEKPAQIVEAMMRDGIGYGLGAKVRDLAASPPSFMRPDGSPCHEIDCSGYVRYAVYHATGGQVTLADGSVNMHDQVKAAGLKECDLAGCSLQDGHTRILFLEPGYEGVGHVVLVRNGRTCESHGGRGPDMRSWGSCAWMKATKFLACYVLA